MVVLVSVPAQSNCAFPGGAHFDRLNKVISARFLCGHLWNYYFVISKYLVRRCCGIMHISCFPSYLYLLILPSFDDSCL